MKGDEGQFKASARAMILERRPTLSGIFSPKSVAVIGASEMSGSVGRALTENLQSFSGRVFAVEVNIRPIRPEDEPLMVAFHKTLSDRSVHLRYFGLMSLEGRITHDHLRRVCFIDYDREIALVADLKNRDESHQILGVARLTKEHGTNEAEFPLLISDPWQGKGLGLALLRLLVQIGRKEHLQRILGRIVGENAIMKVAVFSTKNYDREFLNSATESRHVL